MSSKAMKWTALLALLAIIAVPAIAAEHNQGRSESTYERSAEFIPNYNTTAAGRWIRRSPAVERQQQQQDLLAGPRKFVGDTGRAIGSGLAGTWKAIQSPFVSKEDLDEETYQAEREDEAEFIPNYDTTAAGRWIRVRR
ncbi:hypothetical protein STSP2_00266 [Anaerohalosphaera lusitana]|uniref:Uncharacterized protein n=1 Tax=Anaerohalosphaera lusitana TaxID=1936003 RepID=A0A1U9NH44_9BACT|nr:hypothetical protein [Anaerohalosphaera lusitana]AQT67125.1 hypothetical protein STSP2_00266 [Anaerohalosphaera lusitana]